MRGKYSKDNKKIYNFLLIVRIILILIIIYCTIYIIKWYIENKKNASLLSEITETSIIEDIVVQIPPDETEEVSEEMSEEEPETLSVHKIDFDNLLATNNTTVGWLTVPNTSIDYPVVKASDNSFYLTHSFDKSRNTAGWIFADYRNKFDGTDKNIIIYGHNRKDSSMFATLKNTQKAEWYNNPSNKYITISSPTSTYIYEVFSVYTVKAEDYYLTTSFSNNDEYQNFLNTLKSRSLHNFNVPLDTTEQILTLSTCDATGKSRVVVHARKITT